MTEVQVMRLIHDAFLQPLGLDYSSNGSLEAVIILPMELKVPVLVPYYAINAVSGGA